jgi:hypothetical protein
MGKFARQQVKARTAKVLAPVVPTICHLWLFFFISAVTTQEWAR